MNKIDKKSVAWPIKIFVFSLLLGILTSLFFGIKIEHNPENVNSDYVSFQTLVHIFLNNCKVFIIILTGFFLLKIPTIISLISNGTMLGIFIGGIQSEKLLVLLPPLLTHGILEIVAFLIAAYLVFLGREKFMEELRSNIILLTSGVVLLLISACLETYVSSIFI